MPAFDPVRDAVLNSPGNQTKPLPSRIDLPTTSISFPNSSSGSESNAVAPSPPARRATHLSMLLNDDPAPDLPQSLFTPTTPRTPSSFAHLLHPEDPSPGPNEQLAFATPLRRRSSTLESQTGRDGGYFPLTRSPLAFPSSSAQDPPRRLPSTSPHGGLALPGLPAPLPASPPLAFAGLTQATRSRPSTANSSSSEQSTAEVPFDQPFLPSTTRRRSSGSSDFSREREGSFSYFTPPTRSPLASSSQLPRSSSSPRTRSPASPFAIMAASSTVQVPPRSPSSSQLIMSGSSVAPRPISPAMKRVDRKPSSSAQMPPPPLPPPALATPQVSLPPKQEPHTSTKSASQLQPQPSMPMLPRSNIPYAPKHRITPADSVLIPLTRDELDSFRTYMGRGRQMLSQPKRKRRGSDQEDEYPSKRTRDVGLIAGHYNARPEVGLNQRKDSPIIGLKNFNNWVKSVLISSQAHSVLAASDNFGPLKHAVGPRSMRAPLRGAGKVLDMGCGKGGDLIKWNKARIREYVGVDIASVSVDQARKRYEELRSTKFAAYFAAADCYMQSLSSALPDSILPPLGNPFDVVSMQFCMHYAFESEKKARTMIENVSTWLRPGGTFIGTIPNASWLLERLDAIPADEPSLSFGNSVYSIRFEERSHDALYGQRYWFYLKDAVDDVPEYVVHWDNFVKLADEYGLVPAYVKEFHEVFAENEDHSEFGPLLQNMRVVDSNGESQMDEDQWEAANIYVAFAFKKR
ncbi:mRNA capping enzyme-domain-containing protein [Cytidiella melzeri]|nr:mRNA capping enzyme-domain-containing protein [Cytidiella melzeri]